jgi:carbonic anhydrase
LNGGALGPISKLVKIIPLSLVLSFLAACGGSSEPAKSAEDVPLASKASETPEPPTPSEAKAEKADRADDESDDSEKAEVKKEDAEPKSTAAAEGEHPATSYIFAEASEGQSQSPINIVSSRAVTGKHKIKFHYQTSKEHVDNLGHTVKVTYDSGSSLEYDGTTYDLVQFHFHTPSEHLLDGVTYPMEMHLVHSEHGHPERLLVLGVLFKEGDASSLLDVIADVPAHAGEHLDKDEKVDVSSVLKKGEGYYHYQGSLTTPPYSETVTWLVLDQPHQASAEQIEAMNRIEGNNARHIQAVHARLVDHSR